MHAPSETHLLRCRLPLVAFMLVLLCTLATIGSGKPATARDSQAPSFVVIQTDDQTLDLLYGTMPYVLELIGQRGMTLRNYYVSYPLCCPSRVSLLTGRYAHNHMVRGNVQPNGGFTGFLSRAAASHNLAAWLRRAGYRTIHVGKVLNGYGDPPYDDGTRVPPGWDAWYGVIRADTTHLYYGYQVNVNGQLQGPFGDPGSWETREYGVRDDPGCPLMPLTPTPCNYLTDRLTSIAAEEILATPGDRPLYLQLDYTAPHGDFRRPAGPEPAARHYDTFNSAPLPHDRSEGFDERRVRDKPRFIREAPRLTAEETRSYGVYYQKQLEAVRSVDEGVMWIIRTLGAAHRLRNTYVIFLSDNGYFFGEHRLLGGKFLAYEPATHLPFLIRGPGIRPGSVSDELSANIDIAPTLLELAGARGDRSIDGRSLVPYLRDPELRTRRPILFESFVQSNDVEAQGTASSLRDDASASLLAPPKDYAGIRLGSYKYIAWPSGETELYNLVRDPHELNSLHRVPNFYPIRNFLHRQMLRLTRCDGARCRKTTPKLSLTRNKARRLRKKRQRQREREGGRGGGRRGRKPPVGPGVTGVLGAGTSSTRVTPSYPGASPAP
ncbi:MAG TPA: sulfatase [Solirubrobacterales bacterium]